MATSVISESDSLEMGTGAGSKETCKRISSFARPNMEEVEPFVAPEVKKRKNILFNIRKAINK